MVEVHGESIKVNLWLTNGQERFGVRPFFRNTKGTFIIFSVFDRCSFELAMQALTLMRDSPPPQPIVTILIGHRFTPCTASTQPIRAVTEEEPVVLAKTYCIDYMEVDALTGTGIDEMFTKMLSMIMVDWKELIVQLKLALLCGIHKRAGKQSPVKVVPQPVMRELISAMPWKLLITDHRLHEWIQNSKGRPLQPQAQQGGCVLC
ncbi:hypothetical protein Pelo_11839 [Pelomyxa schiedti]|nr:hypothetical protein Pelo_11839 [Pelomyxa schiedti]